VPSSLVNRFAGWLRIPQVLILRSEVSRRQAKPWGRSIHSQLGAVENRAPATWESSVRRDLSPHESGRADLPQERIHICALRHRV